MTKFLLCVPDIDECKPRISIYCGVNAKCQNTKGSFYCHCNAGYKLLSGKAQFNNSSENTCQSKKILVFLEVTGLWLRQDSLNCKVKKPTQANLSRKDEFRIKVRRNVLELKGKNTAGILEWTEAGDQTLSGHPSLSYSGSASFFSFIANCLFWLLVHRAGNMATNSSKSYHCYWSNHPKKDQLILSWT